MPFLSPNVYSREIDLSLYAEIVSECVFGVTGIFTRGPLNKPTLVSNPQQLVDTFGEPKTAYKGWYAARQYLRGGNQLKVVRVESTATPSTASIGAQRGGRKVILASGADGDTQTGAGNDYFTAPTGDWVNDGVQVGDYLWVKAGADLGYWRIVQVVDGTNLQVQAAFAGNAAGLDYEIITGLRKKATDGATGVASGKTFTSATGNFSNLQVAADDILSIEDDTVGNLNDNGLFRVVSVTNGTTLVLDRAFRKGNLSNLNYSVYSPLEKGTDGVTNATKTFTSAGSKFADDGVVAGDMLVVDDPVDTGDNAYYVIESVTNNTTLVLEKAAPTVGGFTGLTFSVWGSAIKISGNTKGSWADNVTTEVEANSIDPTKYDVEVLYKGVSVEKFFGATNASIGTDVADSSYVTVAAVAGMTMPLPGEERALMAGDDGASGIVDADYIGTTVANAVKGLQCFRNPDTETLTILACPGVVSEAVTNEVVDIAEFRADCLALIDAPDAAVADTVSDALDYTNGLLTRTTSLTSSYAAVYWSWLKVYDEYNAVETTCPPCGGAAETIARTDADAEPWFAPAGPGRGKLRGVTGVEYSPNKADRDQMQKPGQCLNPIVNATATGITVMGQKTCLRTSSALNRVNVRRMLNFIEKVIAQATLNLLFEPNDEVTWRRFSALAEPVLARVLGRRGIREFRIVCDATSNTASVVDQNMMIAKIYIKPTKTAEIIVLNTILTSQGANFDELIEQAA